MRQRVLAACDRRADAGGAEQGDSTVRLAEDEAAANLVQDKQVAALAPQFGSAQVQQAVLGIRGFCREPDQHLPRRSEEHTSELQSRQYLVCRLLLEKKKKNPS